MLDASMLRLHRWVRASPLFHRLMVGTCVLLACGFVPTGLIKLVGERFALDLGGPMGRFFEALYQTGGWWRFIGAAQVLAGLLVLVPRLRAVGAVLFLALLANIVAITASLDFGNTEGLVSMMLLATLFLLVWDYDRVRPLFGAMPDPMPAALPAHALGRVERGVYALGLVSGMVFFLGTRGFVPGAAMMGAFPVAALSALAAVGLGVAAVLRRPRLAVG